MVDSNVLMPVILVKLVAELRSRDLPDLSHLVEMVQDLGHVHFRYFSGQLSSQKVYRDWLPVLTPQVLDLAQHHSALIVLVLILHSIAVLRLIIKVPLLDLASRSRLIIIRYCS